MCVRPVRLHETKLKQQTVPCGQCIECRLKYSRQWAVRLMHEASLHEESCFATLTYDAEHVPEDGSLRLEDVQGFVKRLRSAVAPKRVRFFQCGEYGDRFGRPHHHALLFGHDFADKVAWCSRGGNPVWRSGELDRLWGCGVTELGSVTFESAQYVARYVMKKVRGRGADAHYGGRKPEFVTMSRRPGIGAGWYARFGEEVERTGSVVVRGAEMSPPRYYDELLRSAAPERFEAVKAERLERWLCRPESVRERVARGAIAEARLDLYSRRSE